MILSKSRVAVTLRMLASITISFLLLSTSTAQELRTGPEGGWVWSLHQAAWDSSVIFAGVEANGAYRFISGQDHWRQIVAGFWNVDAPGYSAVRSFATHKQLPDRVLAIAGDSVYVSHNRGDSWSAISSIPIQHRGSVTVVDMQYDIEDTSTVYISRSYNMLQLISHGFSVSRDGGRTWTTQDSIPFGPLLQVSNDPPQLWVGNNLSYDKGETWEVVSLFSEDVTDGIVTDFAYYPHQPDILYALILDTNQLVSDLMVSLDGGSTWDLKHSFISFETTGHQTFRVLASGAIVLPTGEISEDGGATFTQHPNLSLQDHFSYYGFSNVLIQDRTDDATLYLGTEEGVFVSHDTLQSFERMNDGMVATGVVDIIQTGTVSNLGILFASTSEAIFSSENQGESWELFKEVVEVEWLSYSPADPGYLYFLHRSFYNSNSHYAVYRCSISNPDDIELIPAPFDEHFWASNIEFTVDPHLAGTLYIPFNYHDSVRVYKTSDFGLHWKRVLATPDNGDINNLYDYVRVNRGIPGLVHIVTGGFYVSWDYGETWDQKYPNEDLSSHFVQSLFSAENPQTCVLVPSPEIFISHDGGNTWLDYGKGFESALTGAGIWCINEEAFTVIYQFGISDQFWRRSEQDTAWQDLGTVSDYSLFETPYVLTDEYWYLATQQYGVTRIPANQILGVPDNSIGTQPHLFSTLRTYPNPFNSSVRLEYNVETPGVFQVSVYNVLGQREQLIFEGFRSTGRFHASWQPKHQASGVYFIRVESENNSTTKRIVLIR